MTPLAPPGLESSADPKEEEDWIPEGSLYNPKALWSKLRQGRARLSISSQPVWSRSPTPSESTSAARSSLQPPSRSAYRSASYDDLQRFREVLRLDFAINDAPEARPRRWSLSSPNCSDFSPRNHRPNNLSMSASEQNSSHGTEDYSMQNIPKIKLSTSDNTLAISIPSSAPSSGSSRPESDRAKVLADLSSFSLAARRGKAVPKPLALNEPVDHVATDTYPALPTAFMFSPTDGTSDVNRFSTTDIFVSHAAASMDTSEMIKQLQAVASELKPTTPVDAVHGTSGNPIISIDTAESQSDESLTSASSHHYHSIDGLNTSRASRALSIASEDEWAFARDLMENNGDPLPPKSPKKEEVVPPVPVIPTKLKTPTFSSMPVSSSGSASKLLKPVARTGIPKALVPGTDTVSGVETSVRISTDKPTGIQLPSRRVVSPNSTAAANKSTGIQLPSRRVASPIQIASTNSAEASLDSTPRSPAPAPKKDALPRKPVPHHLPPRIANASPTVRPQPSGVPTPRRVSGATPTSLKMPSQTISGIGSTGKATRPISRIASPEPAHDRTTTVPPPRRQPGATPTTSKGSSSRLISSPGAAIKPAIRTTSPVPQTSTAPLRFTPSAQKENVESPATLRENPPAVEDIISFASVSALTARPPTPPLARTMNASVSDSAAMSFMTPSSEDLAGSARPLRGILKQRKKVWWDDDAITMMGVPSLIATETPSPERANSTLGPETPQSPISIRRGRTQSVMMLAASVVSPTASEDARRRSFAGAPSKSDSALDTPSERRTRRAFSFSRLSLADKEAADKENKSRFSLLGGGGSNKRASQAPTDGTKKSSILSIFGKLRV